MIYMNIFNSHVRYKRMYKKNSRRYSLYTVKTKKTYGHIPDLQARILQKRLTSRGMPRRRSLRPDDPRRFGLLPLVSAPTIDELRQGGKHLFFLCSVEKNCTLQLAYKYISLLTPFLQHSRQTDEQQCPLKSPKTVVVVYYL